MPDNCFEHIELHENKSGCKYHGIPQSQANRMLISEETHGSVYTSTTRGLSNKIRLGLEASRHLLASP